MMKISLFFSFFSKKFFKFDFFSSLFEFVFVEKGAIVIKKAIMKISYSSDLVKKFDKFDINKNFSIIENFEFGYNLNDFIVVRDTIKSGDSFGEIMERNKIGYPQIFNIVEKSKDTFNIANLQVGKPYTLLCSKDSLQTPQCFIYQPDLENYIVINCIKFYCYFIKWIYSMKYILII